MVIFALALVITAIQVAEPPPKQPTTPVKNAWLSLQAQKCDLKLAVVATPIEARVLRNTAYAIAGKRLKSAELLKLFTADGGWYTPSDKAKINLDPPTKRCIARLKAHEDALRKRLKWQKDATERRITSNHKVFNRLRRDMVSAKRLIRRDVWNHDGETTWHLIESCGKDGAGNPACNGPQVICRPKGCFMFYPG